MALRQLKGEGTDPEMSHGPNTSPSLSYTSVDHATERILSSFGKTTEMKQEVIIPRGNY